MSASNLLSISNLRFRYDKHLPPVLHELSLDIPAGTITAILGPNGTGKTTLLHVLLGLLPPQAGSIFLDGKPLPSYSRRQLSRLIGLVPQSEYIPFDFSVLEFVLLGRAPYLNPLAMPGERDREIARQALQTIGIEALANRLMPLLSGGESQLVMVARALTQNPRVLLLDEPTSHLDLSNRDRVLTVLARLAKQGVTVLFTTHDPNLAAAVADNVVLLRAGAILAAGPCLTTLTAEHLGATYGIPIEVVNLRGRPFILS